MKTHIICLNGPPRAGKGEVRKILKNLLQPDYNVEFRKFTDTMDTIAQGVLDIDSSDWKHWRETCKDDMLLGKYETTMRKFLIGMSEDWLKKHLGQGIMGRFAAQEVRRTIEVYNRFPRKKDLVFIFDDSGFQVEFDTMYGLLPDKVTSEVARVPRPGRTFDQDSRDWVTHPAGFTSFIDNNGSKSNWRERLVCATEEFVKGSVFLK